MKGGSPIKTPRVYEDIEQRHQPLSFDVGEISKHLVRWRNVYYFEDVLLETGQERL